MLPWLRPYRRTLALGVAGMVFAQLLSSLSPWVLKAGIDALGDPAPPRPIRDFALALVLLASLDGVFRYVMRRTVIGVSRRVEYDLRRALYAHLQRLPMRFFGRFEIGDLMARVTNDLNSVRMFLGPGLMYTGNTVLVLSFCVALMLRISPELTLVALCPLPLVTISVVIVMHRIHDRATSVQEGFAVLNTRVRENLAGVRVVKAFAQEETQIALFEDACRDYLERNMALARVQRLFLPAMVFFTGIATALVLWRGGRAVMGGGISLGEFVAFSGYLALLMWPMAALGWTLNLFQRGAAGWARIRELLEEPPEPLAAGGRVPDGPGEIRFEGVRVRLGGREVLGGLDLVVEPGRTTALVGPTGAGKSTMLKLLPRLLAPDEGRILVDGVPLEEWDLAALRGALSFVPQEAFLFSETIAKNLSVGRPGAEEREIRAVAELAVLAAEVDAFTEGFESLVGERGVTLSGGQRQRTTLARALLRYPRILVLDDAFSNMDTGTEEAVLSGVADRLRDMTVLLVSHRLSTIRRADHVVYVERGRVVESGTHRELVDAGGAYARFVRRQRLLEELEERRPSKGEAA
jgi:ATP-binding cassette subfamily B protein